MQVSAAQVLELTDVYKYMNDLENICSILFLGYIHIIKGVN